MYRAIESKRHAAYVLKAQRLMRERDVRLAVIRTKYNSLLALVRAKIKLSKARRVKLTAVDKYSESNTTPLRKCVSCGETILRANRRNAERVMAVCDVLVGRPISKLGYSDVRRMLYFYCCRACQKTNGEGHSCFCSSTKQLKINRREYAQEIDELQQRAVTQVKEVTK